MNSRETELDCQHHVRLDIRSAREVGDDAYCRFHGFRRITKIWPEEWRVLCAHCSFGRWAGQRESNARRIARNHKHDAFYVYDTITASGGTPRKILVAKHLTQTATTPKFDPNEPIPY